ncbi:MAG: hypothetical protein A2521_05185 [Deltaproteobacteria bacterium RIFOXYD12_FULL_57_12]|nr:MAG: hypothetical protein A2521_05185 [Deltaproteobacteria bacterium RIFOXYD12_FULL_57_12]
MGIIWGAFDIGRTSYCTSNDITRNPQGQVDAIKANGTEGSRAGKREITGHYPAPPGSRKVFVNVFSVANFYNKNNQPIIMNFINNTVIARSDFMKRIIPFHFCCSRVRKVFTQIFYLFFDSNQIPFWEMFNVFQDRRPEFNRKNHYLKSQLLPELFGGNIFAGFAQSLLGIINIDNILKLHKKVMLLNWNQGRNFFPSTSQNYRVVSISHFVNKISKMFSGISSGNCGWHSAPPGMYFMYKQYIL